MTTLESELLALPGPLRQRLNERGFSDERLLRLAGKMGAGREERNQLPEAVEPAASSDFLALPQRGSPEHTRLLALGEDAIRAGRVALCVLAGGMATRMGGVVKACVLALPGKTFLELRLAEQRALQQKYGAIVPLWLMASEATVGPIRDALGPRLDGKNIALFEQCVSLRLTTDGHLFRDEQGEFSVYATGHGDLPDALRASGVLEPFLAERGEDAVVWLTNLDNLGATIDPLLLGLHLDQKRELTVEVVDKVGSDRGGIPVRHGGKPIIAEEFRLPKSFDANQVRVFNTNTFLVNARALQGLTFEFTFVEVEKSVGNSKAVQFERLLGEMTVALTPHFVTVPRDGVSARFLPVKDHEELAARRPQIEAVCQARGLLP